MNEIKTKTKSTVELVPIQGTHHFHMLKPAATAEIILKFLKEKVDFILSASFFISSVLNLMALSYSKIDKAVQKGVLHSNNGNSKKASLSKAFKKYESAISK